MATLDQIPSTPEVPEALKTSPKKTRMEVERLRIGLDTGGQTTPLKTETVAALRALPLEQLKEFESRRKGLLLDLFTDSTDGQLHIDFHKNAAAEACLGAADLLPSGVDKITVYREGHKQRTGERRGSRGFFDGRGYIPIFTGDKVVVGGAIIDRVANEHEPEHEHEPKLSGRSLLIGSSSTVGYASRVKGEVELSAKEGRPIDQMLTELKKIPLEHLREFNRVVIQGGMKNQPSYEKSVKAMTEIVNYLRTNAPDLKIYVLELTPWDQKHREGIEKFNQFLREGKANGSLRIDGLVPLYEATSDGNGELNAQFGKAGALHVSRYDRFAGVVADWITNEDSSGPLQPDKSARS